MRVAIGADHRGFTLKEDLKKRDFSIDGGVEWVDVGASIYQEEDDYPDIAVALVNTMQQDETIHRGILLCGSGAGISIAANKFQSVRCVLALSPGQVEAARSDDNVNVLAIAADFTSLDAAKIMIEAFLKKEFSRLPRHTARIEKIQQIEKGEYHA